MRSMGVGFAKVLAGPTKMRSMGVGFAKVDGWTYKNEVHGSQICEGGRWLDIQKREGWGLDCEGVGGRISKKRG